MAKKKRLSGPERQKFTIDVLRQWQGIERDAIETTAQIMEKTDNLLIRQIMEIIRNDSVQHHRVQQFLIDSITRTPVTCRPRTWPRSGARSRPTTSSNGRPSRLPRSSKSRRPSRCT